MDADLAATSGSADGDPHPAGGVTGLRPSTFERACAIAVHCYTAVGSVLALAMLHYSYQGDVRTVLWLFLVAMVIDGTDGMLARRFRVKEVLPSFDGALLDNIVDYMTYTLAPVVLLWATGYLPGGVAGWIVASIPILASCYQFCRSDAKTDDHFFLGFPSYWNIAAFYIIATDLGVTPTTVILLVLAALVFVPIKYVYPSRTEPMWQLTFVLTALWFAAYAAITAALPNPQGWIVVASVLYLAYYTGLSLWLTWQYPRKIRRAAAGL